MKSYLTAFGVAHILLGLLQILLALAFAASMFFMMSVLKDAPEARRIGLMSLPAGLMFLAMGVLTIVLGLGSIRARRWARAICLALAWPLMLGSVNGLGLMSTIVPTQMPLEEFNSSALKYLPLLFSIVPFGFAALHVWFYSREDVRLTCETRNPLPCWTDKVPLRVLAVAVFLASAGIVMILSPQQLIFFGAIYSSSTSFALRVLFMLVLLGFALGAYRQKMFGWWGSLIAIIVAVASTHISALKLRPIDYYEALKSLPEGTDQMLLVNMLPQPAVLFWTYLPCLLYLLWIRKFFGQEARAGRVTLPSISIVRAISLMLCLVCLQFLWHYNKDLFQPREEISAYANQNTLRSGSGAESGPVEIAIRPPLEFDFKPKAEVMKLREESVMSYPSLISGPYRPAFETFGQIKDDLPWWGIRGEAILTYSSGHHPHHPGGGTSITGLSEESLPFLNPFMLVHPICSIDEAISRNKIMRMSDQEIAAIHNCLPKSLTWWPGEKRASLSVDLSSQMSAVQTASKSEDRFAGAHLDFTTYNAQDFRLNYMSLDLAASSNISQPPEKQDQANVLRQFIHQGGSCRSPFGCNNMSPRTPEWDDIRIEDLPAKAVLKLWHEAPASPEQVADFTFEMRFE